MMERYGAVASVAFDGTSLPLPISVRLSRLAKPLPAAADSDAFFTSIQIDRPLIRIEVHIRDTGVAENLSLGQSGVLSVQLLPTRSGQIGRDISIGNAVLVGIELQYQQAAPASAKLDFIAEASEGNTDPFASQEWQQ